MASSFASQLKDMLVVLVEHVIMVYGGGGGARGEDLQVSRRILLVDPPVSQGSLPQVQY
jgi:hypothetical protein